MSTTLDISARTAPIPVAPIPVAPIPVALNHAAAPFRRPFDVYNRLTETLGEDDVFIVESLSGPARDNRSALLGYGKLLTIEPEFPI